MKKNNETLSIPIKPILKHILISYFAFAIEAADPILNHNNFIIWSFYFFNSLHGLVTFLTVDPGPVTFVTDDPGPVTFVIHFHLDFN